MKKVSVVVPCYNASQYLDKCVGQLLKQTIGLENIEIILVNDASTDDGATWEKITLFEQQYPETVVAICLEENLRQGGARNVGVSYANGEYLIFCDADDWLLEEALEHCYDAAKKHDADVVEFRIKDITCHELENIPLEMGASSEVIKINTAEKRKKYLCRVTKELSLGSQKKMFRLSLIKDNNIHFVEHLVFEEPSFMVPVRLLANTHAFIDESLYICYLSQGSSMRSDWGEHKWDNPQVWLHLMDDLQEKGLLQEYAEELEYLFFVWAFGLSIRMVLQKGYTLTKNELQVLIDMVEQRIPNIRKNKYLEKNKNSNVWYQLLLTVLDMEITEESIKVINEILRKYI